MSRLIARLQRLLKIIRGLTGEDAYERYLTHWRECHDGEGTPMDRKTFYKLHLEHKWNGINRCC